MTDEEIKEKHIKLYNGFKLEASSLSNEDLIAHITELEDICATAKINLRSKQDTLKERKAKLTSSQRSWLVTDSKPDQVTSDAINAVKVRKERMSKGDKVIQNMIDAGLDDEYIEAARRKLGLASGTMRDKFVFNKNIPEAKIISAVPDSPEEIAAAVDEVTKAIEVAKTNNESKTFNPFGK